MLEYSFQRTVKSQYCQTYTVKYANHILLCTQLWAGEAICFSYTQIQFIYKYVSSAVGRTNCRIYSKPISKG